MSQHLHLDFGRFHQGLIMRERGHLRDASEPFVNEIQATAVVRVVELANRFFSRLLQLLEGRPLEEELTAERSKEILAGQFECLGIVALERIAQHIAEEGAQSDRAATMLQKPGALARLGIVGAARE